MKEKIDYEAEVKKVYPDAYEVDNETEDLWPNQFWITDGHGNDISDGGDWPNNAWESAYRNLTDEQINSIKHINNSEQFKGFM